MSNSQEYDFVIIGGGSAAFAGAIKASDFGEKVAMMIQQQRVDQVASACFRALSEEQSSSLSRILNNLWTGNICWETRYEEDSQCFLWERGGKGRPSMKSTHRFQVKAPIESIYKNVLSAEGWLSFVPGYQGLESADPNWPDVGSSITVRYRLLKLINVTVIEHEHGHRFRTREESTGGYIDNVDLTFQKEDGTTRLTFVNDVTQRSMLLRIVFLLMYPLRLIFRELILWRRVKRRIKTMVEI